MKAEQVAEIIQDYAKQNIHIEVVCDGGFTIDTPVCYRGIIHFLKDDGEWFTDDIGCYEEDWQSAFNDVVEYAEWVLCNGTKEAFDKFEPSKISQGVITGQQGNTKEK